MKVLAFDTTNETLSVAILDDDKILVSRNIFENNKHSEMLVCLIEECLNEVKIWYQNLDLIAFTNGPGSFTGIRVGYSCAKALQISTSLQIAAISSLEAIAYDYKLCGYKRIMVVNDAKLEEFFIQEFNLIDGELKAIYQPQLISSKNIFNYLPKENFLLVGSAKFLINNLPKHATIDDKTDFIDAKNIALIAQKSKQQNINQALYIRKPKISKRK